MSARLRTAARLTLSVLVGLVALLVLAPAAAADPTPTPTPSASKSEDPCDMLAGTPAYDYCTRDDDKESDGGGAPSLDGPAATLDPMASIANAIAKSAAWVVDQLSNAVTATSDIDFTNTAFLKTYSLVFAASTFLVLLLWLWAVAKRAIRGAPLLTALGEAVGLLWVTVLASAFTPLILFTIVGAVDGLTEALAGEGSATFFAAFSDALRADDTAEGGGPFARILLALVAILAAGVVWLELVVRSALLYVGAVLGLVVYAGLVDRQLWDRVRKWVGMMVAIILVKPIIVIVLRLASAMAEGGEPKDNTAAIVSGLAIIIIAIVASALLFRMIPGMGDDIVAARRDSYDPASRQSAAAVTRPVAGITQGINAHASRPVTPTAAANQSTSGGSSASSGPGGGIAAHSTRPTAPAPRTPRAADVPRQDGQDRTGRR